MKIAYEGLIYEMMPNGGISRYFNEIINRLPSEFTPSILLSSNSEPAAHHPRLEISRTLVKPPIKALGRFWRKRQFPRIEKQYASLNGDVNHWTYHCGLCYRPVIKSNAPNIVTVYDFIVEHHEELDKKGKHRRWLRQSIEAADHLLCISQTTYDELCTRHPEAAPKASITLLGNSFASISAEPVPPLAQNRPFILFVGRRSGYKNFKTLWQAWKTAQKSVPDLALVAVGPPLTHREAKSLDIPMEHKNFIPLGSVSDGVLKGLYQASQAFIFPTRMEGFGLPAVEAMESGATVLASNCKALAEVCGDAAYYFDPNHVDQISELLVATGKGQLTDQTNKTSKGKQLAAKFSWNQTTQGTVDAYKNAFHMARS